MDVIFMLSTYVVTFSNHGETLHKYSCHTNFSYLLQLCLGSHLKKEPLFTKILIGNDVGLLENSHCKDSLFLSLVFGDITLLRSYCFRQELSSVVSNMLNQFICGNLQMLQNTVNKIRTPIHLCRSISQSKYVNICTQCVKV